MQPCKNLYAFIWIGDQRLLPFSFGPKLFCPPAFLSVIIFEGILPLTSPQVIELKFNVIYDVQLVTINRRNRKQIISKNLLLLPSLSLHVRNKQLTRFYLYKTICKMPLCFCVQFGRRGRGRASDAMSEASQLAADKHHSELFAASPSQKSWSFESHGNTDCSDQWALQGRFCSLEVLCRSAFSYPPMLNSSENKLTCQKRLGSGSHKKWL